MTQEYQVQGMTCSGCKRTVENLLKTVEGVTKVEANTAQGTVSVTSERPMSLQELKKALEDFEQYSIS